MIRSADSTRSRVTSSPGLPCTPTTPRQSGCPSSTIPFASSRVTIGALRASASAVTCGPSPTARCPTASSIRARWARRWPRRAAADATSSSLAGPACMARSAGTRPLAGSCCSGCSSAFWMSSGTARCTAVRWVIACASASRISCGACSGCMTRWLKLRAAAKRRAASKSWKSVSPLLKLGFNPVSAMRGRLSFAAAMRPVVRLVAPGPLVARTTPRPLPTLSFAAAAAASAAPPSCRVRIHSSLGWAITASTSGTIAAPWPPKTCVAPASTRACTIDCATVAVSPFAAMISDTLLRLYPKSGEDSRPIRGV
mmetsp:Transcript_34061/g.87084  ORF Transcript_34061/g.87084 Transcript_34061/m.87084 type:complete len:312 (+) Transcript_34061:106-1041(+)